MRPDARAAERDGGERAESCAVLRSPLRAAVHAGAAGRLRGHRCPRREPEDEPGGVNRPHRFYAHPRMAQRAPRDRALLHARGPAYKCSPCPSGERHPLEIHLRDKHLLFSSTTLSHHPNRILIMKFAAAVSALLFAASAVLAAPSATTTVTVSYDQTYDNANGDLHTVACSDGPNGMLSKGASRLTPPRAPRRV